MDMKKIWIIIAALLAGMMPVAAQEGISHPVRPSDKDRAAALVS